MTEVPISENIRYCDNNGRIWFGKLHKSDSPDGRDFSFDLESQDSNLPVNAGEFTADEIEQKNWIELQGEGGRHLRLHKPLITYVPIFSGADRHGTRPFVLRGIGHDIAESRFSFDAENPQITSISFAPPSASFIIADKWFAKDVEGRLVLRAHETLDHLVPGVGSFKFHLGTNSNGNRQKVSLSGYCRVVISPKTPVTLVRASEILNLTTLFIDFLFGKPMPSPKATLNIPGGEVSLSLAGIRHRLNGRESDFASAVSVSSDSSDARPCLSWEAFFKALTHFWENHSRLVQPMNVALIALQSDKDMFSRFFLTLPTLERFLPTPDMTAENLRIAAMREAFFQYVDADAQAKEFCGRFMHLGGKAKPPTLAMKLDLAIARIRDEGWPIPVDASKDIKSLRDRLSHTATADHVNDDELWPLLVTAATIMIGQVFRELGIPLATAQIHRQSNFSEIGRSVFKKIPL